MRSLFTAFTAFLVLAICLVSCSSANREGRNRVSRFSHPTTRFGGPTLITVEEDVIKKPAGPLVVVDAGHGGKDLGANSEKSPVYIEKQLALSTAGYVKHALRAHRYPIKMTREDDVFVPLLERAKIANDANASLFVSIHYNSAPSKEAQGVEVFYYDDKNNPDRTAASKKLAQDVLDSIVVQTGVKSRGVKAENLAVVRETKMPAILIEGGFLTNNQERSRIQNHLYQQRLSWAISEGIDKFVKESMRPIAKK